MSNAEKEFITAVADHGGALAGELWGDALPPQKVTSGTEILFPAQPMPEGLSESFKRESEALRREYGDIDWTPLPSGALGHPVAIHPAAVGDKPMLVAEAQQLLVERGHDLGNFGPEDNGVDGRQGKMTTAAIKDFQRHHGIDPTGELNAATAAALREGRGQEQQMQRQAYAPPTMLLPPEEAARYGFDGPQNITTQEMGIALQNAGIMGRDSREMAQRLAAETGLETGSLGGRAEAVEHYLDSKGTIVVNGQRMTAAQAKQVIGSANGQRGVEDAHAAAVMAAVDQELEADHPEIAEHRHGRRTDGMPAHINFQELLAARQGLGGIERTMQSVEDGRPVSARQIGVIGKALGDALGL